MTNITVDTMFITVNDGANHQVVTVGAYTDSPEEVRETIQAEMDTYFRHSTNPSLADFTLWLVCRSAVQHSTRKGLL